MGSRRTLGAISFVLVSIMAFAVLLLILEPVRQSTLLEHRTEVRNALFTARADLEGRLSAALTVTRVVIFEAAEPGRLTEERFNALARYLREDAPFIRHLALSEGTIVRHVYPRAGNEQILGLDMRDLPGQWEDVARAIKTRQPLVVGPVRLIQGGRALIQRSPVFGRGADGTAGAGEFRGVVSAVMDMDALFATVAARMDRQGLDIALRNVATPEDSPGRGAPASLVWGRAGVFARDPVTTAVAVPGGQWTLAAVPMGGWPRTPPNWWIVQALSVVVALVLGAGAHMWLLRRAERKAVERERAAMVERLQGSNRQLERFAWAASHELQTPLRQISSYLQLLQRRRDMLDDETRDYLSFSIAAAQRLSRHVADMVAFTHQPVEEADLPPADPEAAAATAIESLRPMLDGIGAEVRLHALPPVRARHDELVSVFQHLLSNAIQYRAEGRPLRVTISGTCHADGMTEIIVADNGPGIDPADRERVFEVFKRLVSPYHSQGTGLGLSICRRIAERSGGRMWITGAAGGGCACHILLPRADGVSGDGVPGDGGETPAALSDA